ncbi:MAG: twin-arginine translocase TatA/TatE family subunit [Acidimicrobiales bacterium]
MNLGPPELIIILIIVFLLFGATRLPKLAKSLGEASKEFKKGVEESEKEDKPVAPKPEDKVVTMTKAELDALLDEREARARRDAPPTSS